MIYINETSGTISIPRHNKIHSLGLTLVVTSNLSNDITLVEDGGDISTNPLYYKLAISNLGSLNVGEYTYKLYGDYSEVLETGLLQYGSFERAIIENTFSDKEKKQYNG